MPEQETEQSTAPGIRRVLGRMGRCVLTYLLLHTTAWLLVALVVWWDDSFFQIMDLSLSVLGMVGVPTLLLAIVAGLGHTEMKPGRFRGALVAPMLLFTWPLLSLSAAEPMLFQIMAQLAFVCYLMPTPLVPENWVGRP
ncbi:hypothetical protein [Streptomyces flavidovirens]